MRRTPSAWSSSPSWTLKGFRRLRGAHAAGLCPAPGPARAAPKGLAPLESLPPPAGGTAGLCPAPGPARAAPKGLAPLESLPSPAGGTGVLGCCPSFVPCDATRQNGGGLRRCRAKHERSLLSILNGLKLFNIAVISKHELFAELAKISIPFKLLTLLPNN